MQAHQRKEATMEVLSRITSFVFLALAVFFMVKYAFPLVGAVVGFIAHMCSFVSSSLVRTW